MNKENKIEKEMLDDELISLFLKGLMNPEEEATFLDELKQNDVLRERAAIQARLVKGMKQADEELLDAFQQSGLHDIYKIAGVRKKKNPARWLAIAASIVFIVFVGFKSYDYYDTTSLGKEYANTFPTSSILRGETDKDVEKELTTLFDKISKAEDLDNATNRLAVLWEQAKQDTYNDYTDYAPYIGWNLAIGYLENYEKKRAKSVLEEMSLMYSEDTIIWQKVNVLNNNL